MSDRFVWTPLHAHLHQTLRSRHLLPHQQQILVAVSGGQDSLCLVRLLLDLQPKWDWQLGIAHCDHCWRKDSAANAHHVKQLATTWKIPFYCQTATAALTSEAAARSWRYQALSAIAHAHGYTRIVTGHTASDRAETLLYNLIRGSGADGLQALTWQRSLSAELMLVRPLLTVTRTETGRFCQDRQLQVWEDATNQDLKYARNRIRQDLLPYLQTHFHPQVESNLAQTAELLQAEVEYLEHAASELQHQAIVAQPEGKLALPLQLNRRILQTASIALQRRAMRQILQQILPETPSFEHIEKLTGLISAPPGSRTDPFPGGAIAEVDRNWIWLKLLSYTL